METIIIAALVGIIVGGGGAAGVAVAVSKGKNEAAAEAAAVAGATAAQNVVEDLTRPAVNMTDPDLLAVACSKEHIDAHGDLLCREMFCRMQTRGMDAKASGADCEAISNIMNKRELMETCGPKPERERDDCYEIFDRRF